MELSHYEARARVSDELLSGMSFGAEDRHPLPMRPATTFQPQKIPDAAKPTSTGSSGMRNRVLPQAAAANAVKYKIVRRIGAAEYRRHRSVRTPATPIMPNNMTGKNTAVSSRFSPRPFSSRTSRV